MADSEETTGNVSAFTEQCANNNELTLCFGGLCKATVGTAMGTAAVSGRLVSRSKCVSTATAYRTLLINYFSLRPPADGRTLSLSLSNCTPLTNCTRCRLLIKLIYFLALVLGKRTCARSPAGQIANLVGKAAS